MGTINIEPKRKEDTLNFNNEDDLKSIMIDEKNINIEI